MYISVGEHLASFRTGSEQSLKSGDVQSGNSRNHWITLCVSRTASTDGCFPPHPLSFRGSLQVTW